MADNCNDKSATCVQDCSQVIATFEKAANSDFSEAGTLAPLYRGLEAMRTSSKVIQVSLASYTLQPTVDQATSMATSVQSVGASAQADTNITAAVLGGNSLTLASDEEFAKKLLDAAKNCIPCVGRILALSELVPSTDFLSSIADDIMAQLENLKNVGKILGDFSSYTNYCDLLSILSAQCIPDLQKMIALLMALFMDSLLPELDLSLDALLQLIAPLFQPIFTAITTLLDQFMALTMSPVECVIAALQLQLEKAKGFQQSTSSAVVGKMQQVTQSATKMTGQVSGDDTRLYNTSAVESTLKGATSQVDSALKSANQKTEEALAGLEDGLLQMLTMLGEARNVAKTKLNFYMDQLKALLGDVAGGFATQLAGSLKKLGMVRMVAFIVSIISAISSGNLGCTTPEGGRSQSELENFVNNFLSPNSSYQLSVDPEGNIVVDELSDRVVDAVAAWPNDSTLPGVDNVVQFNGSAPIDLSSFSGTMESWARQVEQVQTSLSTRVKKLTLTCKLQMSQDEGAKINQWISDLNKAGVL